MSLKELARKVIDRENGATNIPPIEPKKESEMVLIDSDILTERIGIRFDGPEVSGEPILFHPEDGRPLAYNEDTPFIKVYAWSLLQMSHVIPVSINFAQISKDCRLTSSEVRTAIDRLVEEGDLVMTREMRCKRYRLNIQYPEGGTYATGD